MKSQKPRLQDLEMIAKMKTASNQDVVTTTVIQNESLVRIQDLFNQATTHTDHRAGGQKPLNHGLVVTLENALTLLTTESRDAQELPTTLEMTAEITASHQDLVTIAVIQNANQGHLASPRRDASHPPSRSSRRSRWGLLASPLEDPTISLSPQGHDKRSERRN